MGKKLGPAALPSVPNSPGNILGQFFSNGLQKPVLKRFYRLSTRPVDKLVDEGRTTLRKGRHCVLQLNLANL